MPFIYLYTNIFLFYYTFLSYEIDHLLKLKEEDEELDDSTENEELIDNDSTEESDYVNSDTEKTKIE